MSRVTSLPRSLKVKLAWLIAAFVIVWMNAPIGAGGGAAGVPARAPTVAVASPTDGSESTVDRVVMGAATGRALVARLATGEVAESEGVRLGVLAVVDEPVPPTVTRQAGERQVWAYVALDNRGSGEVTYTALDVELSDGRDLFSSVEGGRGPGPMLEFGVLHPGEVSSGWRMFRVPADAGPFQLLCSVGAGD